MNREIEIVRGRDINRKDLFAIVELNKKVYGEALAAPLEIAEAIHRKNPDICIVAKDRTQDRVVGYISAIPLSSEAFDRVLDPDLDEVFTPEDVIRYDDPGRENEAHHLYMASIVVDPDYRGQGILKGLYFDFLCFLLKIGRSKKILLEDIAARATPMGEKICKAVGMNCLGTSGKGEKIFYIRMLPPNLKESSEKGEELTRFYEAAYRRLKQS